MKRRSMLGMVAASMYMAIESSFARAAATPDRSTYNAASLKAALQESFSSKLGVGDIVMTAGYNEPGLGAAIYEVLTGSDKLDILGLTVAQAATDFPAACIKLNGNLFLVLRTKKLTLPMFGAVSVEEKETRVDSSAAVKQAFAWAAQCKLKLSDEGGRYWVKGTLFESRQSINFQGAGMGRTVFMLYKEHKGPVFVLRNQPMGEVAKESLPESGGMMAGISQANSTLTDFSLYADPTSTNPSTGIVLAGTIDQLYLHALEFFFLKGSAVTTRIPANFAPSPDFDKICIRESIFRDVKFTQCGTPTQAVLELGTEGNGDGSNQCVFETIRIIYPNGVALWVYNTNTKKHSARRLKFSDIMIHGRHVGRPATDLVVIEGKVQACEFTNIKMLQVHDDFYCVRLKGNATGVPGKILLNVDINLSNYGIMVEKGNQIRIGGVQVDCAKIAVNAATAGNVLIEKNMSVSGKVIMPPKSPLG